MKNICIITLLLSFFIFHVGCKKKKYLKQNNIILVIKPSNCIDCISYVNNIGLLDQDDSTELVYKHYGRMDIIIDTTTIELNWEDMGSNIKPNRRIKLTLENKVSYGSWLYAVTGYFGDDIIAEKTVKLKPGRIYIWDPENDSFEDTGEETSVKVQPITTSGSNGSSSAELDCADDPASAEYKTKINAGNGCQPCANCAALACYKYMGVDQSIIDAQIEAVLQDVDFYGYAECPELY